MVCGPFILELADTSFEKAAAALAPEPGFVLIDARTAPPKLARHSIIAANPPSTFLMSGGFITVDGHTTIDSPHAALSRFCDRVNGLEADPYLPFSCGLIGYIGFEAARALRGLEPARGFSRHPQCKMGFYDAVVVYDHAEGTARVVANDEDRSKARRNAYILHDRIIEAATAAASPAFVNYAGVKMTPDEAQFRKTAEMARSWIRSEMASRIHLVRHLLMPSTSSPPFEAFMAMEGRPGVNAFLTHEGASFSLSSTDALVSTDRTDLRSTIALGSASGRRTKAALDTLKDEVAASVAAMCETGTMEQFRDSDREEAISFAGRLGEGLDPIDAVIGMTPSHSATGAPYDRVLEFIGQSEEMHRTFYGGAFGTIDPLRCNFRTIEHATTYADGTAGTTMGVDMDENSDVDEISQRLSAIVSQT